MSGQLAVRSNGALGYKDASAMGCGDDTEGVASRPEM